MGLNNYFDKIFVINLERRKDRLELFDSISKKLEFTYEIIRAVDGTKIDSNFIYNNKPIELSGHYNGLNSYSQGQIGCSISHLSALKKAREEGLKNILIFEDDVKFDDNFKQRSEEILNTVGDWDLLFFGGTMPVCSRINDNLCQLHSCYCLHAYAVKNKTFDFFIEQIESNIFSEPSDVIYHRNQHKFNSKITIPFLCVQNENYSDIHNKVINYF